MLQGLFVASPHSFLPDKCFAKNSSAIEAHNTIFRLGKPVPFILNKEVLNLLSVIAHSFNNLVAFSLLYSPNKIFLGIMATASATLDSAFIYFVSPFPSIRDESQWPAWQEARLPPSICEIRALAIGLLPYHEELLLPLLPSYI